MVEEAPIPGPSETPSVIPVPTTPPHLTTEPPLGENRNNEFTISDSSNKIASNSAGGLLPSAPEGFSKEQDQVPSAHNWQDETGGGNDGDDEGEEEDVVTRETFVAPTTPAIYPEDLFDPVGINEDLTGFDDDIVALLSGPLGDIPTTEEDPNDLLSNEDLNEIDLLDSASEQDLQDLDYDTVFEELQSAGLLGDNPEETLLRIAQELGKLDLTGLPDIDLNAEEDDFLDPAARFVCIPCPTKTEPSELPPSEDPSPKAVTVAPKGLPAIAEVPEADLQADENDKMDQDGKFVCTPCPPKTEPPFAAEEATETLPPASSTSRGTLYQETQSNMGPPVGAMMRPGAITAALAFTSSFRKDTHSKGTRETVNERTCFGHKETIYSVQFSDCGRFLASAGQDATIRIWDVAKNAVIHTIADHNKAFECLRTAWYVLSAQL